MEKGLTFIGLNKKEVKLYKILHDREGIPLNVLSSISETPISTTRYTSQLLIDRGLIYTTKEGDYTFYHAEPLEKVLYLIKKRKGELKRDEIKAQNLITEINQKISQENNLPIIRVYTGCEEVVSGYEEFYDLIPKNSTIYSYVNPLPDTLYDFREKIIEASINKRLKKNIFLESISPYNEVNLKLKAKDQFSNRKTYLIKDLPELNSRAFEIFIHKNAILEITPTKEGMFTILNKNPLLSEIKISLFKNQIDFIKRSLDFEKSPLKESE